MATFGIDPFVSVTNNTPPAYSSATVNGDTLTVTFDGALDTSSVPAADAFEVKATRLVTGPPVQRDVDLAATGAVAVDGSTVTLTLAEAVLAIDAVTVAYTAPETDPLQDSDNRDAPGDGVLGQVGDQRHAGGQHGADVRLGGGEREDGHHHLLRGAGRERESVSPRLPSAISAPVASQTRRASRFRAAP